MKIAESNEQLLSLIKAGVSPYHVVQESEKRLEAAGFTHWALNSSTKLEAGKAYYTNLYGTSLVAFRMPKETVKSFRIAAAHTDSPVFHLKPNADVETNLYGKWNVEAYGGAILNTWMDRPLLLTGRVCIKGDNCFTPKEVLYSSKKPVAVIPNLAIHMNREVNSGVALKVQTDMEAVFTCHPGGKDQPFGLLDLLAKELDVKKEDILDYDLSLANAQDGGLIGYNDEMIQAPRLDNLTSCDSCLYGLIESESLANEVNLIALFDNEECGSRTKQGAGSTALVSLMEKILLCGKAINNDTTAGEDFTNSNRLDFLNCMLNSFVISLDVAHASHPNHPEKSDPTNRIKLDAGVVIKMNSNQRYATDSSAISVVEAICRKENIAHQKFVNHADIAGGGTLGSILSSTIPAKTVDIGVPLLGMHSSMELMAAQSQLEMNRFVKAFFQS